MGRLKKSGRGVDKEGSSQAVSRRLTHTRLTRRAKSFGVPRLAGEREARAASE